MRALLTAPAILLACLSIGTAAPPATNPQAIGRAAQELPAAPDLNGYYTVTGQVTGSERPYHGIVGIRQDRKAYRVSWLLDDGSTAAGVGLLVDGVLTVGSNPGGANVVVRYEVKQGGGKLQLVGQWVSLPGTGQTHAETLTWLKAMGKEE